MTQPQTKDEIISLIYQSLVVFMDDKTLSCENVTKTTLFLVKEMEKIKSLKGTEKRDIVIQLLSRFIENNIDKYTDIDKELVNTVVSVTVPYVIDAFISIDKGTDKIKINKKITKFFGCVLHRRK